MAMLDTKKDWSLRVLGKDSPFYSVMEPLQKRSSLVTRYLAPKVKAKLWGKNPLTNDNKIGFASPVLLSRVFVWIIHARYFASLCTSDLAAKDLVSTTRGQVDTVLKAEEHFPFASDGTGRLVMLNIGDSGRPTSLHGGVETIAVSSDFFLRLALQGDLAEFSQGLRAPLGIGVDGLERPGEG